jgi:hypothetical protein
MTQKCRFVQLFPKGFDMGKRGPSSFKLRDAKRAIRSARDAGMVPGVVEIVGKDGVIIRVHAATQGTTNEIVSASEWDKETEKLKKAKRS